ncbi:hypothetical protein ABZR37_13945 [Achromobacter ruhlandii]|uniref:hypothetical protein n=1 Tax=Achromobacter ruhlandii TaxID=72557 RepID=UPI003556ECEA
MADLIKPRVVMVKNRDGVEKAFTISRLPATAAREVIAKYPLSNIPKLGDYKTSEEVMKKLMSYVAVDLDGREQRLTTEALIDNHVDDGSEVSGAAVEDVDAFGKSVELLAGDAEGARSSLEGLGRSAYDAMQDVNSSQAKAFADLKVSLKGADGQIKGTVELMGDLADAIQGKDRRKAEGMLAGVGITDRKTIDLLFKGKQELSSLMRAQKEQGVVTKESVERAREYTVAMAKLRQSTGAVRDGISDWLLPAITWVIEKFDGLVRWFRRHETFVQGFFIALAGVLTVTFLPAVAANSVSLARVVAPVIEAVDAPWHRSSMSLDWLSSWADVVPADKRMNDDKRGHP